VMWEAYVTGASTRKVGDLVKALGIHGISKSEVSRICKTLDAEVEAFRSRPIEDEFLYVWLHATYQGEGSRPGAVGGKRRGRGVQHCK
jgi:putative transposase